MYRVVSFFTTKPFKAVSRPGYCVVLMESIGVFGPVESHVCQEREPSPDDR